MRSIAWLSEKGGTAKTTSAINSAVGLAKLGHRVLLVDADPQANATMVLLEGRSAEAPTLAHVLIDQTDAADAIRPTRTEGLDVLPSDTLLADANVALASELGRERRLKLALAGLDAGYDFVVIDTSPQRTLQSRPAARRIGPHPDAARQHHPRRRGAAPRDVRGAGVPDDHPRHHEDRRGARPVPVGPGLCPALERREGLQGPRFGDHRPWPSHRDWGMCRRDC